MLGVRASYAVLLVGAACVGIGSAIFHPESSRIARLASGGRHGFAQSLFQLGGNFGTALGPLLAAFIVLPRGQQASPGSRVALVGMVDPVEGRRMVRPRTRKANGERPTRWACHSFAPAHRLIALTVLALLVFTKNIYMASLSSYYTFYAIHRFGVSVQQSQLMLFVFLGASPPARFSAACSATASAPRW